MTKSAPRRQLIEGLVAQDTGISDTHLQEFRMNLEQSLEQLETRAESSRRATIRSLIAVTICYIFGFALNSIQPFSSVPFEVIGPIWMLCTWASLITAAVIVGRYWYRHRPALERGRTDMQIAMFGELQRQIADLQNQIQRPGSDGSAS